ncbi:hypothetical protein ACIOWI_37310, partial [Streptomyces sp. NPDC087659]|uniref:hypothetical protein n=1 Tax=Streptomyces sp. NPDC087659 TaxID=3365801 RepID=UPI0037FFCBC4
MPEAAADLGLAPGAVSELVAAVRSHLDTWNLPGANPTRGEVLQTRDGLPPHQQNTPLISQAFHIAGTIANHGQPLLMAGGAPSTVSETDEVPDGSGTGTGQAPETHTNEDTNPDPSMQGNGKGRERWHQFTAPSAQPNGVADGSGFVSTFEVSTIGAVRIPEHVHDGQTVSEAYAEGHLWYRDNDGTF